ncbi:MAG: hypothetical protein MUF54_10855 [Polyangiaceae bacterium]|nr:hypothetical protein [Polyangiaceae bacterium]
MAWHPTVLVERPPEGPARGRWEAAPWQIVAITVMAIAVAAGYWVWTWRRSKKAAS